MADAEFDWADWLRCGLLACWVAVLVYCVGFTERPAPLEQLVAAVQTGRVHTVQAGPPGVPANASGYGTQAVHWQQRMSRYRTEVVMVTPGSGWSPRMGCPAPSPVTGRHKALRVHGYVQRDPPATDILDGRFRGLLLLPVQWVYRVLMHVGSPSQRLHADVPHLWSATELRVDLGGVTRRHGGLSAAGWTLARRQSPTSKRMAR